jgi:hypothetical protein
LRRKLQQSKRGEKQYNSKIMVDCTSTTHSPKARKNTVKKTTILETYCEKKVSCSTARNKTKTTNTTGLTITEAGEANLSKAHARDSCP